MSREQEKAGFLAALRGLTDTLGEAVSTSDGQWTVKGFIDVYRSISRRGPDEGDSQGSAAQEGLTCEYSFHRSSVKA